MSESVEWTIHSAVVLSLLPDGATLPASRLAEYHDVPGPYLAKALQALTRAGIVSSKPGRRGGYGLARPASDISLLDVFRAVEGDETFFRCTEIRRQGPTKVADVLYTPSCAIALAMWEAEIAWRDTLERTSIGDIATSVSAQAPPEAVTKFIKWL